MLGRQRLIARLAVAMLLLGAIAIPAPAAAKHYCEEGNYRTQSGEVTLVETTLLTKLAAWIENLNPLGTASASHACPESEGKGCGGGQKSAMSYGTKSWAYVRAKWDCINSVGGYEGMKDFHSWSKDAPSQVRTYHTCIAAPDNSPCDGTWAWTQTGWNGGHPDDDDAYAEVKV